MGDVWLAPSSAGLVFGDGSTSPPSSEGRTTKKIYSQADANEWLLFDDVESAGAQLLALQAERARLDAQIAAGEDHLAALHIQSEGMSEDVGYGGDMAVPASQEDVYTYIVNAEDEDDNEPSYGYNDGSSALQKEGVSGASLLAGLSKRGGGSGGGADGSAMEEERGDVGVGGEGGREWQRGGIEGYSETSPAKYADVYAVLRDAWGDTADGGANDDRGGGRGGGSGNSTSGFRTSLYQFDFNMDKAEMAAGEAKAKANEEEAKVNEAKAKVKAAVKQGAIGLPPGIKGIFPPGMNKSGKGGMKLPPGMGKKAGNTDSAEALSARAAKMEAKAGIGDGAGSMVSNKESNER